MCSWVVVPQPNALQISKREVCGEQEHVHPSPLKHWLLSVSQVVGLTFSLCAKQGYRYLKKQNKNTNQDGQFLASYI